MNIPEEFGKYLLLKKLTEDPLGETFRAGRMGKESIDQVVLLRVFNGKGCLPLLEPDEFVASGEDVRCEQRDVFERPRQQRRDHTFRHAWREILAGDEAIARYVGTDPTRPWFDLQSGAWQVRAVGVEVENHFEQESNNGGTTPVL